MRAMSARDGVTGLAIALRTPALTGQVCSSLPMGYRKAVLEALELWLRWRLVWRPARVVVGWRLAHGAAFMPNDRHALPHLTQ